MSKLKQLYREIWNERPNCCNVCSYPIYKPVLHNFSHIYSRGAHPSLALVKLNIEVWCSTVNRVSGTGCHELWHTDPDSFWERAHKHGWEKPTLQDIKAS